jgi:hypothetical protein
MSIAAMPRRRARPVSGKSLISYLTAKLGQTEAWPRVTARLGPTRITAALHGKQERERV